MKIQEAARLTGVTERTLRYYDRIGLLHPSGMTESGYRLYDEDALRRLQQILFFRELGFPLAQIREIMDSPGYDMNEALRRHRLLLIAERDRLNGLIDLAERTLKGENDMSFDAFDRSGIDRQRDAYAEEARRRWGGTDAYAESEKKTAGYGKEQWAAIQQEADEIFAAFAHCAAMRPTSLTCRPSSHAGRRTSRGTTTPARRKSSPGWGRCTPPTSGSCRTSTAPERAPRS